MSPAPVPSSVPNPRKILVVRPYDDRFRAQVLELLGEVGFDTADLRVIPAGTSDVECAEAIRAAAPGVDLLLVPFHTHKDGNGALVDGVGPLLLLDEESVQSLPPVVMPVADFSFAAAFPRRHEELDARHPGLVSRLFPVAAAHLRTPATRERLKQSLATVS